MYPRSCLVHAALLVALLLYGHSAAASTTTYYYAGSESHSVNGLCIGCSVQNPSYAVDTGIQSTYSTLKLTVSVLGAYVTQRVSFGTTAAAGQDLYLLLESTTGALLDVSALGGLDLTSYKGGVSNADTKSSTSFTIGLLSGSSTRYVVKVHFSKAFDAAELKFKAGIASALTNMRVYAAWYTVTTLPVELESFAGYADGSTAVLKWSTASEINNAGFDIERSTDGETFTTIATVAGAGTSNQHQDYNYRDLTPLPVSYYRLTQRDYDGHMEQSPIISIVAAISPQAIVSSNPFTDHITATCTAAQAEVMELTLYDISGREIATITTSITAGKNEVSLSGLGHIPAGQYILRMTTSSGTHQLHVLKL